MERPADSVLRPSIIRTVEYAMPIVMMLLRQLMFPSLNTCQLIPSETELLSPSISRLVRDLTQSDCHSCLTYEPVMFNAENKCHAVTGFASLVPDAPANRRHSKARSTRPTMSKQHSTL